MFKRGFTVIIFVFLIHVLSHAQDISGLWRGTLYNDTTRRTLKYEIAISENKGKLTGYTHTFFVVDDRVFYGVKKIKVKLVDGKYILQTDELIADDYADGYPKKIVQVDALTLEKIGDSMILSGPFHTVRTKIYSSLTGYVRVSRKDDYNQSALIPHLEELGLAKDLSFVKREEPVVAVVNNPVAVNVERHATRPVAPSNDISVKKMPVFKGPAADVASRKIETVQSVYFKSDSLELTLYDNGEVDGDTVSVLMNGAVIMPMQGLSTKAIRKTIYISKDMPDSIQLLMYAENLGSIPPNTGLLVVKDGKDIYEIRFSGDYNKSSAIVFKRKR